MLLELLIVVFLGEMLGRAVIKASSCLEPKPKGGYLLPTEPPKPQKVGRW